MKMIFSEVAGVLPMLCSVVVSCGLVRCAVVSCGVVWWGVVEYVVVCDLVLYAVMCCG